MRAFRPLALVAGIASIGLATLLVASPAAAQALPSGQRITVISQDDPETGPVASTYSDANSEDASLTQVGSPAGVSITSLDVNDDGVGYGTAVLPDGDSGFTIPALYPTDAKTGVTSAGVPIVPVDDSIELTSCPGIDLQPDGTILVACMDEHDGLLDSYIGVVTPAGAFTAYFDGDLDGDVFNFTALAFNAVNSTLYVFGINSACNVWTVDTSDTAWSLGTIGFMDSCVTGADFDRDGVLWFTSDIEEWVLGYSIDVSTTEIVGVFAVDGIAPADTEAITVWGKKALPATGPDFVIPVGLGTALLFLAGAAFIATSRIQRRSE